MCFAFKVINRNGESQTVESSTHQPTQVVKQLIPGDHTITIKPNKDMKIAAVFSRDESEQTVKGATYSYPDFKGMTLTSPNEGGSDTYIYWGGYGSDIPSLTNFKTVVTGDTTAAGTNGYGFVPRRRRYLLCRAIFVKSIKLRIKTGKGRPFDESGYPHGIHKPAHRADGDTV